MTHCLINCGIPSLLKGEVVGTRDLAACRTWGDRSEGVGGRGQFGPDVRRIVGAMQRESGAKWTALPVPQPIHPKSDRLLARCNYTPNLSNLWDPVQMAFQARVWAWQRSREAGGDRA